MKALTMVAVVVLVVVFSAPAEHAWAANSSSSGDRNISLKDCLTSLGQRLDCYFTIEKRGDVTTPDLLSRYVTCPESRTIAEMIDDLKRILAGYEVLQSKENPVIFHIVDTSLLNVPLYWQDQRKTLSFSGATPSTLCSVILGDLKRVIEEGYFVLGQSPRADYNTKINVIGKDFPVRRILTDFLPLSRYSRILWVTTTTLQADIQSVSTSWGGPVSPVEPSVSTVLPFSLGEESFRRNQRSAAAAAAAVDFVKDQMKKKNPHQVRWALFYLGKYGGEDAAVLLLKYLTYKYTTCDVLEESYPAALALSMMGKAGAAAALKAIPTETDDLRLKLLCRTALLVQGQDEGAKSIEAEAAKGAEDQAKRIREALKAVSEPQTPPEVQAAK